MNKQVNFKFEKLNKADFLVNNGAIYKNNIYH